MPGYNRETGRKPSCSRSASAWPPLSALSRFPLSSRLSFRRVCHIKKWVMDRVGNVCAVVCPHYSRSGVIASVCSWGPPPSRVQLCVLPGSLPARPSITCRNNPNDGQKRSLPGQETQSVDLLAHPTSNNTIINPPNSCQKISPRGKRLPAAILVPPLLVSWHALNKKWADPLSHLCVSRRWRPGASSPGQTSLAQKKRFRYCVLCQGG